VRIEFVLGFGRVRCASRSKKNEDVVSFPSPIVSTFSPFIHFPSSSSRRKTMNTKKDQVSCNRTPEQPSWTNRMLHRAMGVPTDDSPADTVLSKVSPAPPSTLGSIDAARRREGVSPLAVEGEWNDKEEGDNDDDHDDDNHHGGPVDPPEESTKREGSGSGRGVDPEEKEDALEPEPDALENSLEEVVGVNYEQDDDDNDDDAYGPHLNDVNSEHYRLH